MKMEMHIRVDKKKNNSFLVGSEITQVSNNFNFRKSVSVYYSVFKLIFSY